MQAKIVFRGSKCFREFDLKTVAEKLGLSIDDFNHFALAVDERTKKRYTHRYTHKFLYSRLNALPSMFPAGSLTGFSTW